MITFKKLLERAKTEKIAIHVLVRSTSDNFIKKVR